MVLSKSSIRLSCFFFIATVRAFTIFEPDCSAPTEKVNFVAAPNTRGTLDILLKSIFTIFACTWTIHHPNVPRQYHSNRLSNRHRNPKPKLFNHFEFDLELLIWRLKGFLRSTGRMILTIFAPEVIIAVAYNELLAARADHKKLEKLAKDDGHVDDWSWDHTYYANMGGFVIEKKPNAEEAEIGNGYNLHHLTGRDLYILRKKKCIEKLPNITQRELKDRIKSDSLIKAISITQIIWSTARILDRAARQLPICVLELTVIAFALCAVVVYGLYWHKPKSIGVSTTVHQLVSYERICRILEEARVRAVDVDKPEMEENSSTTTKADISTCISTRSDSSEDTEKKQKSGDDKDASSPEFCKAYSTKHIFSLKKTRASLKNREACPPKSEAVDSAPMRIDTIRLGEEFDNGTLWALLVGVVLFGGIHIGGWKIEFPSKTDQMLWKVATIYSVGCVFIALVAVFLRRLGKEKHNKTFLLGTLPTYCGMFLHIAGLSLYVVARLVILFEMFWTLLFLPPHTYTSSNLQLTQ